MLGTSSSESVLPRLMDKLEKMGCQRSVVGLVVPAGYSFNLDGTCIYLTMAAVFLAQATDTPMTLGQQILMLAVLLLTSKGAAGVTGSGFIVLAGTLAAVDGPPLASLALILGIDRFMSEARALTNLVGNALATLVVSRWTGRVTARARQADRSSQRQPACDRRARPAARLALQSALPSRGTEAALFYYRIRSSTIVERHASDPTNRPPHSRTPLHLNRQHLMDINERIARSLFKLRDERGISAGRTGGSQRRQPRDDLSNRTRGKASPTAVVLNKLAIGLGVLLPTLSAPATTRNRGCNLAIRWHRARRRSPGRIRTPGTAAAR